MTIKTEVAGWNVTTRLLPNVIPGSKVSIESNTIPQNSEFKVMELVHKGDTHGTEWTTTMEVVNL